MKKIILLFVFLVPLQTFAGTYHLRGDIAVDYSNVNKSSEAELFAMSLNIGIFDVVMKDGKAYTVLDLLALHDRTLAAQMIQSSCVIKVPAAVSPLHFDGDIDMRNQGTDLDLNHDGSTRVSAEYRGMVYQNYPVRLVFCYFHFVNPKPEQMKDTDFLGILLKHFGNTLEIH